MDPALIAMNRRAEQLLQTGQYDAAARAFEELLERAPALPDAWFNLAWTRRALRRFDGALAAYQAALDHDVRAPEEAHINRAAILADHLYRTEAAEAELRRAVALAPGRATAWLNLGGLYEELGDAAQAADAYRAALDLAPESGRAWARLAGLEVVAGRPAAAIDLLEQAGRDRRYAEDDAAEIIFALGHALDAAGRYDEAFAAFTRANGYAETAAGPAHRYDPAAHERLIDAIIAAFPEPAPASTADPEAAPIFICGMLRSGSTLTEQMLARHPQVTAGGELEFLPSLVAFELQPWPAAGARLSDAEVEALRRRYRAELRAIFPDAERVTDKRPDNFLHIGLIKRLFPAATIVHTVRAPLDNLLSLWFLHAADSVGYSRRLEHAAHWFGQYRRLMGHWRRLYPDIHDVDYDRLVTEPGAEMAGLLAACGLDWDEACLASRPARGPIRTASVWQVRQPLHRRSSARWRHYERHLAPLRAALGTEQEQPA